MLSAQLNHKVPTEFEGMEDVLTSSAFALLRYLAAPLACRLLSEWADISLERDPPMVDFWPHHPTPVGFPVPDDPATSDQDPMARGDTEPDVIVETGQWLVLAEVKYRSDLDDAYDQLGREFAIGYRLAGCRERRFRLLVLTANALEPRPGSIDLRTGVQQALGRARKLGNTRVTNNMIKSVPESLRWMSWHHVYRTVAQMSGATNIADNNRQLLWDTCRLLEMRGLKPYSSEPLVDVMERWEQADIPIDVWTTPISYRYRTGTSMSAGWAALSRLHAEDLKPLAWDYNRSFNLSTAKEERYGH